MTLLQSRPTSSVETETGLTFSRRSYVLGGTLAGFFYGLGALVHFSDELTGRIALLALASSVVGGALVGTELHGMRSWKRFGRAANLARWVVAFTTTSATIASALLALNVIQRSEFLAGVGLGALAGMCFFLEQQFEESKGRAVRQPLSARRLGLILLAGAISVAAVVFFL